MSKGEGRQFDISNSFVLTCYIFCEKCEYILPG